MCLFECLNTYSRKEWTEVVGKLRNLIHMFTFLLSNNFRLLQKFFTIVNVSKKNLIHLLHSTCSMNNGRCTWERRRRGSPTWGRSSKMWMWITSFPDLESLHSLSMTDTFFSITTGYWKIQEVCILEDTLLLPLLSPSFPRRGMCLCYLIDRVLWNPFSFGTGNEHCYTFSLDTHTKGQSACTPFPLILATFLTLLSLVSETGWERKS